MDVRKHSSAARETRAFQKNPANLIRQGKRNGSYLPREGQITPFTSNASSAGEAVVVFNDITEELCFPKELLLGAIKGLGMELVVVEIFLKFLFT